MRTDDSSPHLGGNYVESDVGDPNTYFPKLWEWLIKKYEVKSIIDIGCGAGYSSVEFKKNGCHVVSIDGLPSNVGDAKAKGIVCVLNDYTISSAKLETEFDLCWMCEFVEHVEEQHISKFMENVKASKVVAMTHGLPGQWGHHHVNLQPQEYWIDVFNSNGYELDAQGTLESRSLASGWWKNSGMIFIRTDRR